MNLIQKNILDSLQKSKNYVSASAHAHLSYYLLLFFFIFTLFSCDNEPKITTFAQKPQNLVNHNKMKVLLTEIHLAEAQVQFLKINNQDTARAVFNEFQKKIFLKNKIDSLDFDKSYEYYVRSLQMDSIYQQVVDTMKFITKKKSFGHEVLPKPRKLEEIIDTTTQKNQKNNKGKELFNKNKKISTLELS